MWSVDKEDGGRSVEGLFEPATDRRLTVAAAPTTVTSPGNVASLKQTKNNHFLCSL